jgi:hypothetical protein
MVPSAFVIVDALPLTPNGKLDRKALPVPDKSRPDLSQAFIPPRNVAETALAEIWAVVLKLERIGVPDNFFDLGGHSLLATQVVARAREAFQVELPLRVLFEHPTVAGLAVQIDQVQTKNAVSQHVADALADLESLSDDEATRLLYQEARKDT